MARTSRQQLGDSAESIVVDYLRARGFSIVGRNVRVGKYELDIVARKGELVAVVEVRTRGPGAWTTGFGSMDQTKQRNIRRGAERLWRSQFRNDPSVSRMRFDAASVVFDGEGAHVTYAIAAF